MSFGKNERISLKQDLERLEKNIFEIKEKLQSNSDSNRFFREETTLPTEYLSPTERDMEEAHLEAIEKNSKQYGWQDPSDW